MNQPEESTQQVDTPAPDNDTASTPEPQSAAPSSNAAMLLMDVKLPIRVLLGRTHLCLRDVAHLGSGSVVELDCSPNDPVEIIVNDRVIAHGEMVVVAGNYGVRITAIPSHEEKREPAADGVDLLALSEKLK